MKIDKKRIILGLFAAAILVLSACVPAAEEEPTPNAEAIRTQAVQTAVAELTLQAALNPTATEVPATLTPLPTATKGTAVPAQASSGGTGGSSGGSGGTSGTPIPTWTPDVYKCEVIDEFPYDQALHTGWMGDKIWTVRNVGIVTWDADEYYLRQTTNNGSYDLTIKDQYPLRNDVDPYDTYDVIVDVWVPTYPKDEFIVEWWAIVNDNGDEFCKFYIALPYTYPAPTKTPTEVP